jgi:acyl-CoA synthetase (NDP forming)
VANRTGMGFRAFVSTGDALDVGTIDLLEWWEDDPHATTVLLQAEQFGSPRDFIRVARRVSARKPIVAVTSGDAATAALLGQAGVIHAATFDDMFDTALVLAHQPIPRGRGVAIVSNARDPAELAARACAAHGLELALDTPGFTGGIRDLGHAASAEDYRQALTEAMGHPDVHAVLAVFLPPLVLHAVEVAAAIVEAAAGSGETTLVASYMSTSGIPEALRGSRSAVPSFTFPERAIAALGRAAAYGTWRREAAGVISYPPDMRRSDARRLLTRAGPGALPAEAVTVLLRCYGIRVAPPELPPAGGPAAVVSMHLDPLVGPVLKLGLHGAPSDVFGDVVLGVTPLTDRDAHRLVASLRALPLLTGSPTAPARDVAALEDALLRLSALVDDHERVVELRIPRLEIGRETEGVLARSPAVTLSPLPSGDLNR